LTGVGIEAAAGDFRAGDAESSNLKLNQENFAAQLAQRLAPVYLISGDEPLLVGEAADAIRQHARAAGFDGREVFFIERGGGVSWDAIRCAAQSLSLFAQRRIVEIRMPTGRPGSAAGAAALLQLVESAGADLLLLIITGRLERDVQSAEWVELVQQRGAWLPVWPVERARLPQWLRTRLHAAGLTADEEAIALLAERTEGNLLAARQEIDKLALLHPAAPIGAAQVAASSADGARFDVFQLGAAVAQGNAARALRILSGLRAEGVEAVLVIWSLVRELRSLQTAARSEGAGAGTGRGWSRPGPGTGPAVMAAQGQRRASRLPYVRLTMRAARADRMAKGQASGDPWDEMMLLVLELCGLRSLPLPRTLATA
jgi:DNA polymerase-3 subunit delta